MQQSRTYVLFGILVVLLILLIQNTDVVTLRFLVWHVRIPQIALLMLIGGGGFAAGYLLHTVQAAKRKRLGGTNAGKAK